MGKIHWTALPHGTSKRRSVDNIGSHALNRVRLHRLHGVSKYLRHRDKSVYIAFPVAPVAASIVVKPGPLVGTLESVNKQSINDPGVCRYPPAPYIETW